MPRVAGPQARRRRERMATPATTAATARAAPHSATSDPVAGSAPGRGVVASGTALEAGVGVGVVGVPVRAGTCTWMTIESSLGAAPSAARGSQTADATSTAAVALKGITEPSVAAAGEREATGE